QQLNADGFLLACNVEEIQLNRAKIISANGERIAIFRYDGKLSAVSNVCKHQNGPLGEGKIVDGCITCPWHGYQYQPHDGCSPPPFKEKVATYRLKLIAGNIYVDPKANEEGVHEEPLLIV
ncbi:MAG: Rieske 2Fe-2S domain-containing protein, partial [Chitinophagales bacterium]